VTWHLVHGESFFQRWLSELNDEVILGKTRSIWHTFGLSLPDPCDVWDSSSAAETRLLLQSELGAIPGSQLEPLLELAELY